MAHAVFNSLAAIPDRPDRRPRPARAEAAAIVATAVKARPAEIVPVAIVPVITWGWIDIPGALVAARHARSRSLPGVSWKAVIRWLLIARQEAVSMPAWRWPLVSRRSRRNDRQQRKDDSNQWKHAARHQRTIDGRLLRGDSNLSAQCSAAASGPLARRALCAGSDRSPRGFLSLRSDNKDKKPHKDKKPRGHYTAWPLRDCAPLGPQEIPSRGA
ncbi:hypothetical protein V1294_006602 [Bradyrhizobium sp. AZCC 1678]